MHSSVGPTLPDVLPLGLRLVICGTAAGTASAIRRQYYAGPGNRFWTILYKTGITDSLLTPKDFPELPTFGVGLTDVEKQQSGSDASIDFEGFDRAEFDSRILTANPAILCFNGKRAGQIVLNRRRVDFGLQPETIGRTELFVVPSTSGLARRWWDPSVWHSLAARLRAGG